MSLSQKISYAKKIVWPMLKKKKGEKNVHAKRHERKKCMPKSMKKRKEKERNKDSPNFQIKRHSPKREIHDSKEYKNILELGSYKHSTHLHVLIKVYDLHLLEVRFFTAKYVMQVCPTFHTYPKLHSKAMSGRI